MAGIAQRQNLIQFPDRSAVQEAAIEVEVRRTDGRCSTASLATPPSDGAASLAAAALAAAALAAAALAAAAAIAAA